VEVLWYLLKSEAEHSESPVPLLVEIQGANANVHAEIPYQHEATPYHSLATAVNPHVSSLPPVTAGLKVHSQRPPGAGVMRAAGEV